MNVTLPDGTTLTDIPEGTTQSQIREKLAANGYDMSKLETPMPGPKELDKPPQGQSAFPYVVDKFKQGVAGTLALPALGTDVMQMGLDVVTKGVKAGTEVAEGIAKKVGITPAEAKKEWFLGNDPDKENVGGYKQAKRGIEALLRSDRLVFGGDVEKKVEIPKDAFGGTSKTNEYMGSIAEFMGGALIPGTGPVVASQRKLLTAMTEMGGATLSGMSAVEGKQWGGNLAPSFGLTKEQGEQVGEILGSVAGPKLLQAAAQKLAEGSKLAVTQFNKTNLTGVDANAQKEAAKVLLNQEMLKAIEHNPESAENLARVAEIQKKMEGFRPNAAQASGAPGLIAMTKEVSQQSPEALAKAAAVDARNQAAIGKFTEKNFPATTQPVNEAARARAATSQGIILQDLQNTDRQLTALADKYNREVDKGATGQALRDLYWQRKDATKEVLNKQIADVYKEADRVGLKADMTDVKDAVQKLVGSDREAFQSAPGLYRQILSEFGGPVVKAAPVQSRASAIGIRRQGLNPPVTVEHPSTEVSFEKLHSLWREANKDWMDLTAAGKFDEARKISIVKDRLKQKVDKFAGPEYGSVGQKFSEFNKDYSQYSKTFREGAGGTMGQMTKKGYSKDAEDIVDKVFLRSGDKAKGIQDFFQVYGRDERAAKLLQDGITDNFARSAVDANGNFSARGAANWMKRNEKALEELPNLRAKLQAETDVGGALVQRRQELNAQRNIWDRTVMNAAAKAQRPELLVEAGMKDPRMFKALLASAKTPESQQALARSIVDMVVQRSGAGDNAFKFVQENEKVLKPVMDKLGKDHWNNLKTLAEADSIANRVKAPKTVELSKVQDPVEGIIGTTGKGLFSRARNVASGYMSKGYAMLDVGGKAVYKIRTEELARLRQEALFDPDVASVLAKVVTKDRPAPKDLLDLKALAYQAGISIASVNIAKTARHEDDRRAGRLPPPEDPDEGKGKWK